MPKQPLSDPTRPKPGPPVIDLGDAPVNSRHRVVPPIKNNPKVAKKVQDIFQNAEPSGETIKLDSIGSLYQDHLILLHVAADTGKRQIVVSKTKKPAQPRPAPGLPKSK